MKFTLIAPVLAAWVAAAAIVAATNCLSRFR
jgi:hypothetical protein